MDVKIIKSFKSGLYKFQKLIKQTLDLQTKVFSEKSNVFTFSLEKSVTHKKYAFFNPYADPLIDISISRDSDS